MCCIRSCSVYVKPSVVVRIKANLASTEIESHSPASARAPRLACVIRAKEPRHPPNPRSCIHLAISPSDKSTPFPTQSALIRSKGELGRANSDITVYPFPPAWEKDTEHDCPGTPAARPRGRLNISICCPIRASPRTGGRPLRHRALRGRGCAGQEAHRRSARRCQPLCGGIYRRIALL